MPNRALRPGSSSFASCAREIAITQPSLHASRRNSATSNRAIRRVEVVVQTNDDADTSGREVRVLRVIHDVHDTEVQGVGGGDGVEIESCARQTGGRRT